MTEILCVCCPVLSRKATPNQPTTPQVCDWCRKRLADDLHALPESYSLIDAEPVRAALDVHIGARSFESTPPLNIHALSLLGPGSDTPPARLDWWAQDWAGLLGQQLPGTSVLELCGWLVVRLDWACDRHRAVDEFAQDIRDLTGQLRMFSGKELGEKVGRCPKQQHGERCNTPLYVDPYVDEIECVRCHTKWRRKRGEWMHLRAQQLAAGVEAAA